MSAGGNGTDTATRSGVARARLIVGVVVLVLVVGAGFAATRLIHRTEVLDIARVEARSDDASLIVVASHNDCSNDPTARVVLETSDAVTVRAERRRNFPADACDDIGEQTQFRIVLAEPLGERTILVDAPYGPTECVIDGMASDRCVAASSVPDDALSIDGTAPATGAGGTMTGSVDQGDPVVASSPTTSLATDVIATDVIATDVTGVVPSPGWSRVPDPPLTPRVGAAVFEIGFDVFVMGGRDPACDVAAGHCTRYADGAAFNLPSHTWRVIADAPVTFDESMTGDAGVVVPVLTTATGADAAEAGDRRLLLYDPVRDSWSVVDGLPADAGTEVRPAGEGVLVHHRRSDETARQPDYLYSRRTQEWTALPPTLLPPSAERWFFSDGALLCLFATPAEPTSATTSPTVITKCFDTGYGEWLGATDSTRTGSDIWRLAEGRVVLVPSGAAGADGGVFDLRSQEWTALPSPPDDRTWPTTIAGALDLGATAVFVRANGWVLDLQTGWFLVPPFDDREEAHATNAAGAIFVFGGRRVAADGTIEHLADAWIWTPAP